MNVESLASRLGIDAEEAGERTRLGRAGIWTEYAGTFDPSSTAGRHRLYVAALGVRLGIDRLRTEFDFEELERPSGANARNVYEVPPTYGERLQFLIPSTSVDLAERISGVEAVREPWLPGSNATLVLLRETGRELHWLARPDLDVIPWSLENMREYARLALFYDAYGARPREVVDVDGGQLKWFQTTDGRAAAWATLLPDFDYDAALAGGGLAVVDRDRFVIAHPRSDRLATLTALTDAVEVALRETPFPFSAQTWLMSASALHPGDSPGFGAEVSMEGPISEGEIELVVVG